MFFNRGGKLLRVLEFNGSDVYESSLEDMGFDNLKWVDCKDPTEQEVEKVQDVIKISKNELERCLDEDERPGLIDIDNFTTLVFKAPIKGHDKVFTSSFSLLVSERLIVSFSTRDIDGLDRVWSSHSKTLFQRGSSYIAYTILERVMDDYFHNLDEIEKNIDYIESKVFHIPDKATVREIFSLKRTLIYFQKALSADREVISGIEKGYCEYVEELPNFRYVYDDIVQLVDMVATYRDILTGSLDIYLSSVSNNMNKIMKKITALGSLVLVPTFITGLYGMNFQFMPEITWKYGYAFAWGLIAISFIFLFWYFRKKEWL